MFLQIQYCTEVDWGGLARWSRQEPREVRLKTTSTTLKRNSTQRLLFAQIKTDQMASPSLARYALILFLPSLDTPVKLFRLHPSQIGLASTYGSSNPVAIRAHSLSTFSYQAI